MNYDSNYWKQRILAKYTTSLTKQQILDSFASNELDATDENVELANSYLISTPYNPYGKNQTHQDIIDKIDKYAEIYGFTHDIALITKDDLLSAISNVS